MQLTLAIVANEIPDPLDTLVDVPKIIIELCLHLFVGLCACRQGSLCNVEAADGIQKHHVEWSCRAAFFLISIDLHTMHTQSPEEKTLQLSWIPVIVEHDRLVLRE